MKKYMRTIAAIMAAAMIAVSVSAAASAADSPFVISGDDFRAAYSTSGKDIINYITFKKVENYELLFTFKLKNGTEKAYTAQSTHLSDTVAYLPMQDMLDKLKISADDITGISVSGDSLDNVVKMSFSLKGDAIVSTASDGALGA